MIETFAHACHDYYFRSAYVDQRRQTASCSQLLAVSLLLGRGFGCSWVVARLRPNGSPPRRLGTRKRQAHVSSMHESRPRAQRLYIEFTPTVLGRRYNLFFFFDVFVFSLSLHFPLTCLWCRSAPANPLAIFLPLDQRDSSPNPSLWI